MLSHSVAPASQEKAGSIRGVVYDADFNTPLAAVQVMTAETNQKVTTTDQGNFVFGQMQPGKYTLVFTKDGYVRLVKTDIVVLAGQLTDVDVSLSGEFTEMEEFIVQDLLQFAAGSEAELLKLRFESPALMDSISADLISRAGVGDAASALRLVAGATVQDGKYAVVRGLPDRYVSSQLNSVRLPTADENKRAVELDQYPSAVIESVQVSKTFTPDQQGDASGGAVNVRLKGAPNETILQFKAQTSYNSQVTGRSDFLTYDGGGVSFWGSDDGDRDIQYKHLGDNWTGAAGVSRDDAPFDYKWSGTVGGKHDIDDDVKIGGFANVFYERDSSFFDDGINDSYWVVNPGEPMSPETSQGAPKQHDFKTSLFDVEQGKQSVQWGVLGGVGMESKSHSIGLTYLYTRSAQDVATLAEDTRGKAYFDPSNLYPDAAPYLRLQTLEYTERTTATLQLSGEHKLPIDPFDVGNHFKFRAPELDWTVSQSSAAMDQPDKRQFGSMWKQTSTFPDGIHLPYTPAANYLYGNFQRIWKDIDEDSDQYSLNLKLPFEQWSEREGYLKFGLFEDQVHRTFNQDTFSNFNDPGAFFEGDWEDYWSDVFPFEDHPITESFADVDYSGDQEISAWYTMIDMPVSSSMSVLGGVRFESTELGIVNNAESDALWYPAGATSPIDLNPGDADVSFEQDDVLPSIGVVVEPSKEVTLRGSYSETVARQTFKELTPIKQYEYLGAPVFVGNPDLEMSALRNYDLRLDYVPYEGSLISTSWFKKDIDDPIEYVQRLVDITLTTPVNYPKGELSGYEFEARQRLDRLWDGLEGFSLGANATFIDSEVTLPDDEAAGFDDPSILAPMSTRDMTNAPEHLYNLYLTYDSHSTGTQVALFYTVQGDTLVAGAGTSVGEFVPSVYAKEFDTLNLSLSQKLGKFITLQLQAKNLTNPEIEEVYRSQYIGDDVTKTSYTKGIEYSIGLSASISF